MTEAQKNVSISLGSYDRELIDHQIQQGRFTSRSEVVRAGLRLLDDYENHQKMQRLRTQIFQGDADYDAGRFTEHQSVDDLIAKITKTR